MMYEVEGVGTVTGQPNIALTGSPVTMQRSDAPGPKPTVADMNAKYANALRTDGEMADFPGKQTLETIGGNLPGNINDGQASFAVAVSSTVSGEMRANAIKLLGFDIEGARLDQKALAQINNNMPLLKDQQNKPADMKVVIKFSSMQVLTADRFGRGRIIKVKGVKFF